MCDNLLMATDHFSGYRVLVRKYEEKGSLWRLRHRWKMISKSILNKWDGRVCDWMHLTQNKDQVGGFL
jgi:hypothetical protein